MHAAIIDPTTAMSNPASVKHARDLSELWSRLASRHVSLATACACGAGGVTLVLEDFELDIFDYLKDNAERSGIAEVAEYFADVVVENSTGPLIALFDAAAGDRLPPTVLEWVLPKLDRTLTSFAELHGIERSAS